MTPFFVYLLRCADGSFYAGHTDDLGRRLAQHQAGETGGYTHTRRPVELAWTQETATREEALAAELQIKGWSRAKKEALTRGDWARVSQLAQSRTRLRQAQPERDGLSADRPEPVEGQAQPERDGLSADRPEPVEGQAQPERDGLSADRPEPVEGQARSTLAASLRRSPSVRPELVEGPADMPPQPRSPA